MAFYKIEWKNSAVKELRRLPKRLVAKIISATEELTENPFPAGSRKIIGAKHTYRIRMGDYRIVFGWVAGGGWGRAQRAPSYQAQRAPSTLSYYPNSLSPIMNDYHHRRNHNVPGHAHELTFSCYRGYRFLQKERICRWLAESIDEARANWHFHLWAYVFMPEHVHLIVHPEGAEYDIADIKKAIKSPVGSKAIRYMLIESPDWIPRITRKRGKKTERLFWQSGGGFDRNIVEPKTLTKMIDYIHMNPVRKGFVEKPQEWKWSSAAWYSKVGESPVVLDPIPPGWLWI